VEHLVFVLHTHCYFFLLLALLCSVEFFSRSFGYGWSFVERHRGEWLVFIWMTLTAVISIYNIAAYRAVYRQSLGKTLVKTFLLLHGYGFQLIFSICFAITLGMLFTLLVPS
jgi:hypothetical protein